VQVVGREFPALLLQLERGGAMWAVGGVHVDLVRHAAALAQVAGAARCDDVFPACPPAFRAGDEVVEGEIIM
jgi:hypothetical protein